MVSKEAPIFQNNYIIVKLFLLTEKFQVFEYILTLTKYFRLFKN